MKLRPDLSGIIWSTYLGGNGTDASHTLKLDKDNGIFLAGALQAATSRLSPARISPAKMEMPMAGSHTLGAKVTQFTTLRILVQIHLIKFIFWILTKQRRSMCTVRRTEIFPFLLGCTIIQTAGQFCSKI
jgi:hypothetical protein